MYSGFHGNSNPKGFPKLPGAMAGQSGKRGRFFPRQVLSPLLCTGVFLQRGGPVLPQSRWEWETQKFPPRKKVGAVFYIPDYMKIRTPRAFPNCPERWRDNPESAKDFSPGEGDSPVMHRRIFVEGRSCSSSQSRREWETQKLPLRKKVGVVSTNAEPIDKARGKKTKKGLG